MRSNAVRLSIAVMCAALIAAGCGGPGDRVEVTESKTVTQHDPFPDPELSMAEQLGFRPRQQQAVDAPPVESEYAWDTPYGWRELEPTTFRVANFAIGPDQEGECYLTVLPGGGGGLAANINRWREQMSLPPLDEEAIAELPTIEVLGEEAVIVEMEGTYVGMRGDRYDEEFGLGGILVMADGALLTIKMTAPLPVMQGELDNMIAFAQSLEASEGTVHAHDHGHDHDHDHAHDHSHDHAHDHDHFHGHGYDAAEDGSDYNAHGEVDGHYHGFGETPGFDAPLPDSDGLPPPPEEAIDLRTAAPETLAWDIPERWREGPERPLRDANFVHPDAESWECYLTVLPGPAGGAAANINRWRDQMGQAPLDATAIADLPTVPMLDGDAKVIEIVGDYTGMQGPTVPDAKLLGAVLELPEFTVFVKMTGPADLVAAEREAFETFCRSLRVEQ